MKAAPPSQRVRRDRSNRADRADRAGGAERRSQTGRQRAGRGGAPVVPALPFRPDWLLLPALAILTLVAFWDVTGCQFINWDDNLYVMLNPLVRGGLTAAGVVRAFSGPVAGYYIPLTWLALMAEMQLFGPDPAAFHAVNLALHTLNVLLLYGVLRRATRGLDTPDVPGAARRWVPALRCALVAALFAVHPLRVESVAWVVEIKDVLGGAFALLSLGAYVRYAEAPGPRRYGLMLLPFALGMLVKPPMLLPLPFLMLLLDYWPLRRLARDAGDGGGPGAGGGAGSIPWRIVWRRALEKLPLLALAAAAGAVTLVAQRQVGVVRDLSAYGPGARASNAIVSYAVYLYRMVRVDRLAVLYPLRDHLPAWQVVGAALLLVLVTVTTVALARRRPWLIVGWLWYLAALLPVIGIVQAWEQAQADRFTYLPMIGILLMLAWSLPDPARFRPAARRAFAGATVAGVAVVLVALVGFTRIQVGYWHDSVALWTRTLAVTRDNPFAEYSLGDALASRGDADAAIVHLTRAVELKPNTGAAHDLLGSAYMSKHDPARAVEHLRRSAELDPGSPEAQNNLGFALAAVGDSTGAIDRFSRALRIAPGHAPAHLNLGILLARRDHPGDQAEADAHFQAAYQLTEGDPDQVFALGGALLGQGFPGQSLRFLRRSVELRPDWLQARQALSLAQSRAGGGAGGAGPPSLPPSLAAPGR